MNSTKLAYIQAQRMARKQGIKHTVETQQLGLIRSNLRQTFGYVIADKALSSYRPTRNLETLKYLFALMSWAHRSEDHWRQLQRDYGRESQVAQSAYTVFRFWDDLYFAESLNAGGMLTITETTKIVDLWRNAQDRADWRRRFGSNWPIIRKRAQTQIIASAKRSLRVK